MHESAFLGSTKPFVNELATVLCPDEADLFNDMWSALDPIFKVWVEDASRGETIAPLDIAAPQGLGFAQTASAEMPIAMLTAVASMLELWDAGGSSTAVGARATVAKYAQSFGAGDSLKRCLVAEVPAFCFRMLDAMSDAPGSPAATEPNTKCARRDHRAGEAFTVIMATETLPELRLDQVVEFKKQHSPSGFHIWIDDSQREVFVDACPIQLGRRPTAVLRCLVEFHGQRVRHSQLVQACGKERSYKSTDERVAWRWISDIRQAAGTPLSKEIESSDGGYRYVGCSRVLIIRLAKDAPAGLRALG